jgi:type VI secretion system protein ImpL
VKKLVNALINILCNRWFIQALGLIAVALLIWFVGPLIAVAEWRLLASEFSRLLAIMLVMLLWGGNLYRLHWQALRRNEKLLDALSEDQRRSQQAQDEESGVIRERFEQALAILKNSNSKSSQYLYELPWYIIIGPPGSGKTTALVNSGLKFPLAGQLGDGGIQGVGGTRNCDWWFTDEAVLVDTAGRFTTQDSHESVDRAAWQQFMQLLKTHRPQQPINGALITVSLGDLLQQSEEERRQQAALLRRRIEELHVSLGIRFPVYMIFTKCDLVPGFSEFFANYGTELRAQVWGETFAMAEPGVQPLDIADYPQHFDSLVERLQQQQLAQLQSQGDREKRSLILGFPGQFAALRDLVGVFLEDVFSSNRYKESALLRGVYFTSGTQSGTPIDRLLGSLVKSFGFAPGTLVGASGKGKSYFIRDLLKEVIFREAEVAGVDGKLIRSRLWRQRLSYAAALGLLTLGIGGWNFSYLNNEARVGQLESQLSDYQMLAVSTPLSSADFAAILPELEQMKAAAEVYVGATWALKLGLYQGDKLEPRATQAYHQVLQRRLLPVLVARIEELILANDPKDTDTLYALLKVYLMYGGVKPYETELLSGWAEADWRQTFALDSGASESLSAHMRTLMEQGFEPVVLNEALVSQSRIILAREPLARQVYLGVKRSLLQNHSRDLPLKDLLGGYGGDLFVSRSNRDLRSQIIPGMFTKQGFYQQFLPNSKQLAKEYLSNNWVMGEQYQARQKVALKGLQDEVFELYYLDYISQWDGLLKDLKIKSAGNAVASVRQVGVAAGLDSPLRGLLEGLQRETSLTQLLTADKAASMEAAGKALASVSGKLEMQRQKASRLARTSKKAGLLEGVGPDLGLTVEEHFKPYHNLINHSDSASALDRVIKDLGDLHGYLDGTIGSPYSSTAALDAAGGRLNRNKQGPFEQLSSYQTSLPREVSGWVQALATQSWGQVMAVAKQELNTLWRANVVEEYQHSLAGRYPLVRSASSEATLLDFSRFFTRQGTLDSFFTEHLANFVDTQGRRWTEKRIDGMALGLSRNVLGQLQRAASIRDVFFQRQGSQLHVPFRMKPLQLDASVSRFKLTLGDQEVSYRHGPRRSSDLVWPLAAGFDSVRVQFEGQNGGLTSRSEVGPWAWFRLLQSSELSKTRQRAVYQVAFREQGSEAVYELRADSVVNPFGDNVLSLFRLPESL